MIHTIKAFPLLCPLIAAWLPLEDAAADYVIYQDDLSRTGLLNGSPSEAGSASWVASENWSLDGSRGNVSASASAALLPFKPRAGNRYTLSVQMRCTAANPVCEWMGLGFADGFSADSAWHDANNPPAWMCASNPIQQTSFRRSPEETRACFPESVSSQSFSTRLLHHMRIGPSNSKWMETAPPVLSRSVDEFSLSSINDDSVANLADGIRSVSPLGRAATALTFLRFLPAITWS